MYLFIALKDVENIDIYLSERDIWKCVKELDLKKDRSAIYLWQGSRSGSQNCGKKLKTHFLEIVQYTCNTTFLYQNLMGSPKEQKKYKFPSILAATYVFYVQE